MTLVAAHLTTDAATVCTDAIAYGPGGQVMTLDEPKVAVLAPLAALTAARGDHAIGLMWNQRAQLLAEAGATFDELAQAAPAELNRLVGMLHAAMGAFGHQAPDQPHDAHLYLIGWSETARRFRGVVYASTHDWEPLELTDEHAGMHVAPAPPGIAPSELEQRHHRHRGLPPLPDGAPATPPLDVDGWRQLVRDIFEGRARAPFASGWRIPIGGAVTLTTLTRDGVTQEPIARIGEADVLGCFTATPPTPAGKVGRNAPCPCGSGIKAKKCTCAMATAR